MTGAEAIQALWETALASSAAVVLVLLLRRPVRRFAGCRVAYMLWGMVPVALLAVLLPAPLRRAVAGMPIEAASTTVESQVRMLVAAPSFDWSPALLVAWAVGMLMSAVMLIRRQRRFVGMLGSLRPCGDDLWQAESVAGLPAVVGLRPRIVLPSDFEARYAIDEQRLILAHERMHVQRGDPLGNALAAVLRCVHWFNPLLAFAADRYRRDQELACDEAVIARHPASRRAYGEAMLKTELAVFPAPLACQWFGSHPLKERIAMLGRISPSLRQWISGSALVLALTVCMAYAAWAAQPERLPAQQAPAADAAGQVLTELPGLKERAMTVDAPVRDVDEQAVEGMPVSTPPKYPAEALKEKVGGKVILLVDVAADGSVTRAEVESATPPGVFDAAALEAARKWKFVPETQGGKPVAGRRRVPVTFEPRSAKPAVSAQALLDVRMNIEIAGRRHPVRVVNPSGAPFAVSIRPKSGDDARTTFSVDGTATLRPDGNVDLVASIRQDGRLVGDWAATVRQDVPATMQVGGSGQGDGHRLEVDVSADPMRTADVAGQMGRQTH